jgi:hypothetical protein
LGRERTETHETPEDPCKQLEAKLIEDTNGLGDQPNTHAE